MVELEGFENENRPTKGGLHDINLKEVFSPGGGGGGGTQLFLVGVCHAVSKCRV